MVQSLGLKGFSSGIRLKNRVLFLWGDLLVMVFEGDAGKFANRAAMAYHKRFGKYPLYAFLDRFLPRGFVLTEDAANKYAEYLASLSELLPNTDPPDILCQR